MKNTKALIISIGTATRPDDEAVESLVHGIIYSINNSNPDKVFFVVSKESESITLPQILKAIKLESEVICIEDADDINKIYEDLSPKFKGIKDDFDYITVDYTSGTKAMTGALTILGSLYEVDTLSYVIGKKHGGIVIKGTEQLLSLHPYPAIVERKLMEAVTFFNKCQFDTSLVIISQIEEKIPDPTLLSKLLAFKNTALAYSAWDKFNHQQAFNWLKEVKISQFNHNKAFLGKLLHCQPKEPYYIIDIISNAERRGKIEQKYDDAVARLYRVIELIAQYRLKSYGIEDTANVPPNKIPPDLTNEFKATEGKIKIGLQQAYQFLAALNDDLGRKFMTDEKLKELLNRRNVSILAHGLKSVSRSAYDELKDIVITYALPVVKDLDQLLSESTFIKWPE